MARYRCQDLDKRRKFSINYICDDSIKCSNGNLSQSYEELSVGLTEYASALLGSLCISAFLAALNARIYLLYISSSFSFLFLCLGILLSHTLNTLL